MADNVYPDPRREGEDPRIATVRSRYGRWLMRHQNVVGISEGTRVRRGLDTGKPCLVVYVTHKEPLSALSNADVLPTELDGVPVDVREVGPILPQLR